ncbi:MAG: nickel pincer cofactor biosynthesis protein LarC [Nanobdellota archaeon]
MKTIYFECLKGVSGDMILSALIDTGIDIDFLKTELKKLNLDFEINLKSKKVSGISTKTIKICQKTKQPLRHRKDILKIINESSLEKKVKDKSKNIIDILAKAEASVHSTSIDNIHFHEIGAIDTIIDIVGAAILAEKLDANIISSKINLGSGSVEIEHGTVPVPAPATAEIAKDMLTFSTDTEMEIATPTGVAILKGLANDYSTMPAGIIKSIGYGSGSKSDDYNPNILRVFIIEQEESEQDEITEEINTNIDDSTPEMLGHTMEKLMDAGALDVYFTPINMKKNRPGVKLSVIAKPEDTNRLSKIILKHTTTTGIRINKTRRKKLDENFLKINIKGSPIKVKLGYLNKKLVNISPEYEDCKKLSENKSVPLKDILNDVIAATKNKLEKS